jgi:hypothetical protein
MSELNFLIAKSGKNRANSRMMIIMIYCQHEALPALVIASLQVAAELRHSGWLLLPFDSYDVINKFYFSVLAIKLIQN